MAGPRMACLAMAALALEALQQRRLQLQLMHCKDDVRQRVNQRAVGHRTGKLARKSAKL